MLELMLRSSAHVGGCVVPFKCVHTMGGVVVHLPESDRKRMASAPLRISAAQIKLSAH